MQQERKSAAHRYALALTALAHALVALALLASHERPPAADASAALQVTWIEPPPAPPTADTPPPAAIPVRPLATTPARVPRPVAPDADARRDPEPPAPAPSRPLSAVFIEQGKALARSHDGADFVRNPLVDRASAFDAPAERIRMREPMSPARVVASIGQLFGGPDYETSPCPRIRRNIAALGPGGDRAAVEEEVRRHQQFCE